MTTVGKSLHEIKKMLRGLSNELSSVNAKMDGAEISSISRFDAVKTEIDTVKTEIDAVKTEIDAVKTEIDAVKTEIDAVKLVIVAVKSEMSESEKWSKARSDALRVQLMDMEKSTDSNNDRVKSVIDTIKSDIDSIKTDIGENRRVFNGEFTKLEKNAMIRFDAMSKMIHSTRESIGVLKGKMNSTNQEMSSLKSDLSSTEEMIVDEMSTVRQSIESMRADAESTTRALRAVEGEMTATSNSMRNVETAFVYRTETFDSSKSEFESLKTAIESFEGCVSIGMSSLKAQVSQVEEKVTSVTESLSKESMSLKTTQHLPAKVTMILIGLDKKFPDFLRNVCVDSLVGKTVIHGDDSSKLSIVRSNYESLYSRGPLVSILMKFLLFHPKARVHIDFGSNTIGRMKTEFIDFDGDKQKGGGWSTFPDLEEERVYLGGDLNEDSFIAILAHSLCTMCLHLLYGNGGLPFKKDGDAETEKKWDEMLQEWEGKKGIGWEGLRIFFHALNKKTRKGKLIYLISLVPFIIADSGSSDGINTLREWLPSILDIYQQQVVPDLTRDWESKMAA